MPRRQLFLINSTVSFVVSGGRGIGRAVSSTFVSFVLFCFAFITVTDIQVCKCTFLVSCCHPCLSSLARTD